MFYIINYNPNYNIVVLNDEIINSYIEDFPELIYLFNKTTIAAAKSDIARIIILYMNGGLWLDANTVFVNENSINLLFEKYKNFDFVITVIPLYNFDMASGAMLSKKNPN